jgi:hypothetical protein
MFKVNIIKLKIESFSNALLLNQISIISIANISETKYSILKFMEIYGNFLICLSQKIINYMLIFMKIFLKHEAIWIVIRIHRLNARNENCNV